MSAPAQAGGGFGGLKLIGLAFSRETNPNYAIAFDEVNCDDLFIYETTNSFAQRELIRNVFGCGSFNAGTGDLAALAFGPVLSIKVSCVDICLDALAGKTYQLEYRSSLTTNQWAAIAQPFQGSGSRTCIVDTVRGEPQRLYRVREL